MDRQDSQSGVGMGQNLLIPTPPSTPVEHFNFMKIYRNGYKGNTECLPYDFCENYYTDYPAYPSPYSGSPPPPHKKINKNKRKRKNIFDFFILILCHPIYVHNLTYSSPVLARLPPPSNKIFFSFVLDFDSLLKFTY